MSESSEKSDKFFLWEGRKNWSVEHMEKNYHKRWKHCIKTFEVEKEKESDTMMPTIYEALQTILPTLFSKLPKVIVTPENTRDIPKANFLERELVKTADENDLYNEMLSLILAGTICGEGWLKWGYSAEFGQEPKSKEEVLNGFFNLFGENGGNEDLKKFVNEEKNTIKEFIEKEGAWIKYASPFSIFPDPEGRKVSDCRWIIHKELFSLDEFKDKWGEDIDIAEGSEEVVLGGKENKLDDFMVSDDAKRVVVYEVWCKTTNTVYVMADGHDSFLDEYDWPYNDYPFGMYVPSQKMDSLHGLAEIWVIRDSYTLVNEWTGEKRKTIKKAKGKMVYTKGSLDEDQAKNIADPDKDLVEVTDPSQLQNMQTPSVPGDIYNGIKTEEDKVQRALRVSEARLGGPPPKKTTATAVNAAEQASNVQTLFKVQKIEQLLIRVIKSILDIMEEYSPRWPGGKYNPSVKVGSSAYQDEALRLQQKMQFLGQVMQLYASPVGQTLMPNVVPLLQELLLDIGDLNGINPQSITKTFASPPIPPGAVQGMQQAGNPAAARPQIPGAPQVKVPRVKTPLQTARKLPQRPIVNAPMMRNV